MNRREVLPLLGLPLLLAGCTGQSVTRRFRVIATAEVYGEKVEGSTVMEITYSRVTGSASGSGGATKLYGEALILDLKGKTTVYVLPVSEDKKSGQFGQTYEHGVLTTLGIRGGVGVLSDESFGKLRQVSGRFPFYDPGSNKEKIFPIFAAFRDEKSPRSIYEIDPLRMSDELPGVKLISFEIEFTEAPVTSLLRKRLPWLTNRTSKTAFERDPPGRVRPDRDVPLNFKIVEDFFFARGSRS